MHHRNHGNGTVFYDVEYIRQSRRHRWLAKFANIRPRNKGSASGIDPDRLNDAFGIQHLNRLLQPLPHREARRIHWRIINANERNRTQFFNTNRIIDCADRGHAFVLHPLSG